MEDQIINDLNDTRIKRRVFPSPAAIRYITKRAGYSGWYNASAPSVGKDIWMWTI